MILASALLMGLLAADATALPMQAVQSDAGMRRYAISIEGAEGVRIAGSCLVTRGRTVEKVVLDETVPQRHEFEASGLSCQIRQLGGSGRLAIEMSRDGRVVSRHVSSGSSSIVHLSVQ